MTQPDERLQELKDFEREEGIPLPLFSWRIIELEDMGYIVDLVDGTVYNAITVATTSSAQAVAYLLSQVEGEIVI